MTKNEALKLALEALENIYDGFETSPRAQYTAITAIKEVLSKPEEQFCYCDDSISLQIVSGGAAVGGLYSRVTLKIDGEYVDYVKAQPEQEPVLQGIEQYRMQMAGIRTASIGYWKEGDDIHPDYDTLALRDAAKLYAKYDELYKARWAETKQAPVGTLNISRFKGHLVNHDFDYFGELPDGTYSIYTAPPKREWIRLTVEQIEDVGFNLLPTVAQKNFVEFARAIEAAHGIKETT